MDYIICDICCNEGDNGVGWRLIQRREVAVKKIFIGLLGAGVGMYFASCFPEAGEMGIFLGAVLGSVFFVLGGYVYDKTAK